MAKNAIIIPSQAVQIGQSGKFVFVIKDNQTVEIRPVTTGQREEDNILITSGLQAEENVVLEGQISLFPGASVSIKENRAP